ncbi:AI-2E family transporter [Sphingobacterium sp. Mn56C]|uniref:AI-2E family transporter n=1 Tax=Sphingobacterium sp. Mn56C TaxID=3395261 RepID=UPI003BD62F43
MGNAVFSQKERNIIILIIIIVLGGILLYAVKGIFSAILGTMVMYTLFRNLNIFLIEKWRFPKPLSAVLVILLSIIIIVLPFAGIGSMMVNKAIELRNNPAFLNDFINAVNQFAGEKLGKPDLLKEQLQASMAYAGGLLSAVIGGAANAFLIITVMYFLLYFMFVHTKGFEKSLAYYLPFEGESTLVFAEEFKNLTYANIVGQTIIAIVQGACLTLGFWLFGVNDGLFWGVICAIMSFVPLVGPVLIFVPAAVILFSQGQTWQGAGLLIWGFGLVINIDNVLRLIIAKKVGDIHPIITVIGVIIGLPLFGLMGLVYGPLLLSFFIIAVRVYKSSKSLELKREQLEERPRLP